MRPGYRRDNDSCLAVDVPGHGYLTSSGGYWACERGYKRSGEGCVAVIVPSNAHIGYSDDEWVCNPGVSAAAGHVCSERIPRAGRALNEPPGD